VGKAELSPVFHAQRHGLPQMDGDERSIVRAPDLAGERFWPKLRLLYGSGIDLILG
jgi:hypothetical protein